MPAAFASPRHHIRSPTRVCNRAVQAARIFWL